MSEQSSKLNLDALAQLPQEGSKLLNETVSTVNDAITEIVVRTNESLAKGILRKLLTATVTAVSIGFAGLITYSIYVNYKSKKIVDFDPVHQQMLYDEELESLIRKSKRSPQEIEEIMKRLGEFKLSDDTLKQIMEIIESEMDKGLRMPTSGESELKMIPTYVCNLPSGKEDCDVLALDLGGSNFRVLYISLRENEPPKILNKVFIVSESIMKGSGEKVKSFIYHIKIQKSKIYLFIYL